MTGRLIVEVMMMPEDSMIRIAGVENQLLW